MFHLFSSKKQSSQWAATDDRSGQKLPSPDEWTYHKTVTESRIGFDAAAAAAAVAEQGYCLFSVGVLITEMVVTL